MKEWTTESLNGADYAYLSEIGVDSLSCVLRTSKGTEIPVFVTLAKRHTWETGDIYSDHISVRINGPVTRPVR